MSKLNEVNVSVEHPGILEVPEGKTIESLGEDHFKSLIKKKGWGEISKALINLNRWNKDRDPKLSKWADNMQAKLHNWVESQRKEKGDENLYEGKLLEKWAKEVEVERTGEHAGKSIAQLKKEIAALRGKPGNKEKMGELLFALRAKEKWPKHTGIAKESLYLALGISESELDRAMIFIYENEIPEEASNWKKFINEDATLEQKMKLIQKEGVYTSFDLIERLVEASAIRCRKCNGLKTTWERQRHIAECNAEQSISMLEVANELDYYEKSFFTEWLNNFEKYVEKFQFYTEKWGKDVEIEKTGEHAGKTIAQLKKEIKALRGKPGNKEKMGELLFALRSKQHWRKSTGLK